MAVNYIATKKIEHETPATFTNQAVADIVSYFKEEQEGTISEVCRATGIPSHDVVLIMRTLLREGLIMEEDPVDEVPEERRRRGNVAEQGQGALDKLKRMFGGN